MINGSGERRYDDLAATDGEAQRRRVSGGGSDGGDGDAGLPEAVNTAALTTTTVLLPMIVALPRAYVIVAGVLELVPLIAAVLLLEACRYRTAAAGRYDESSSHHHSDSRLSRTTT